MEAAKRATIHYEASPIPEDMQAIEQILHDYNQHQIAETNYLPLTVTLRDANGRIVGGLRGNTYWDWLYVDTLAVAEAVRGQGYGARLLAAAEQEARSRGCHSVYLDTFDFQALPFYQKQGYEVFGMLDHFPGEHKRYFLQKRLELS